jgi:hypothetical protein
LRWEVVKLAATSIREREKLRNFEFGEDKATSWNDI